MSEAVEEISAELNEMDVPSTPAEAIGAALEPADDPEQIDRQIDRAVIELERFRRR